MHSPYTTPMLPLGEPEEKILPTPIIEGMRPGPKALTRRGFLGTAGALFAPPFVQDSGGVSVNDVHSQLNSTQVRRIVRPASVREVQALLRDAGAGRSAFSVCGSRHAMGGQQFGTDTTLLDLRSMNKVRCFDATRGLVEVDAGIEWPALIQFLAERQKNARRAWGIAQKQTGADRLTIAGALSANAHGRGLRMTPLVGDVESLELVDATGRRRRCSRTENRDFFGLAIGGYGLFGVITAVTLRLVPRRKIQRIVEVRSVDGLMEAFAQRIADGFIYGDFQYAIDPRSDDFMRKGVFSCYRPVSDETPIARGQKELADAGWAALLHLAHTDGSAASQAIVLVVFALVCVQFSRGNGYFVQRRRWLGTPLWIFGWIYAVSMVVRYAAWMALRPEERWTGDLIPVVFHVVLASFLLVVADHHRQMS